MSGAPWLPYSNSENAKIKSSMVFYCDRLNANYVKFYAHILIQFKVADIKTEVMEGMNISNDYVTMMNGVEKIKEVSNAICERFGILNVLDLTAFEEAAAKFKPVMH
jgi:hypothetical protein